MPCQSGDTLESFRNLKLLRETAPQHRLRYSVALNG